MDKEELTTKEVAERLNVKPGTVWTWCDKGLFKNARKESSVRGDYWIIPASDLNDFELPKRGRKRETSPSAHALAKRRQREKED